MNHPSFFLTIPIVDGWLLWLSNYKHPFSNPIPMIFSYLLVNSHFIHIKPKEVSSNVQKPKPLAFPSSWTIYQNPHSDIHESMVNYSDPAISWGNHCLEESSQGFFQLGEWWSFPQKSLTTGSGILPDGGCHRRIAGLLLLSSQRALLASTGHQGFHPWKTGIEYGRLKVKKSRSRSSPLVLRCHHLLAPSTSMTIAFNT